MKNPWSIIDVVIVSLILVMMIFALIGYIIFTKIDLNDYSDHEIQMIKK
jgi:hypothetical protein